MTMDGHVENFDAYKVETIGNTCVYAVDVIDDSVIDVVKTKLLPPRVFFLPPRYNYTIINITSTCTL